MAFVAILKKKQVTLWAASYSACVVYTKTIIHLSVGESGGSVKIHHYSPPLRLIIVNYHRKTCFRIIPSYFKEL